MFFFLHFVTDVVAACNYELMGSDRDFEYVHPAVMKRTCTATDNDYGALPNALFKFDLNAGLLGCW